MIQLSPARLLASDLDGTILFQRTMSNNDVASLKRWHSQEPAGSHQLVCCTGKSLAATRYCIDQFGVPWDFYVIYTGAVVCDSDYRILHASTLGNDVMLEVWEFLSRVPGIAVYATTLDTEDVSLGESLPQGVATDMIQTFVPLDLARIPEHQFVGVPIWVPAEAAQVGTDIDDLQAQILARFGDVLDCHRNQDFLDIVPKGATKGSGLQWLLDYLGTGECAGAGEGAVQGVQESAACDGGRVELLTAGDSFNDLDMHRIADISASFPHSPAEVQAATTHVVGSMAEFIDLNLKH